MIFLRFSQIWFRYVPAMRRVPSSLQLSKQSLARPRATHLPVLPRVVPTAGGVVWIQMHRACNTLKSTRRKHQTLIKTDRFLEVFRCVDVCFSLEAG